MKKKAKKRVEGDTLYEWSRQADEVNNIVSDVVNERTCSPCQRRVLNMARDLINDLSSKLTVASREVD